MCSPVGGVVMKPVKKSSKSFRLIVVVACLLVIAFIALHGAAAYKYVQFRGDIQGLNVFAAVLVELEARASSDPLGFEWNEHSAMWLGVSVFAFLLAYAHITLSKKKMISGKEHGTAVWGSKADIEDVFAENVLKGELAKAKREAPKEFLKDLFTGRALAPGAKAARVERGASKVAALKERYENADMLLTETERISIYNWRLNINSIIFGGSGSGKSRSHVLPNLLQAHSSFVVTDPKGELLAKAGKFLVEVMGYELRVLNIDNMAMSDCYNPFSYLWPDRPGYEGRVLVLIETIIANTDGGEKQVGNDPFWGRGEECFLTSLFMFASDGFPDDERSMNTFFWLMSLLKIEEEQDNLDSDLDYFVEIFAERFGEDHLGVELYREFRGKAAGKTAKSIVMSAVGRFTPFRTKDMKRVFSHDVMNLSELGEKKMAVFVVVPPTSKKFNFVAGMLFTQMFQELQYCATVKYQEKQQLPVPVRFILDEFANTCKIPNFPLIIAYARSFGIGIAPILQSLDQLKAMYKDDWGVIIDNCASMIYLGRIACPETLKFFSELLGKGTFDKCTSSRTRGKQGSSSRSYDVIGRDLMDPSEIRKMPDDDCLLIVSGRSPFYSKKYKYKSHPNYQHTSDADPSNIFRHKPISLPEAPIHPINPHGEDERGVAIEIDAIGPPTEGIALLNGLRNAVVAGALEPVSDDGLRVEDGEPFGSNEPEVPAGSGSDIKLISDPAELAKEVLSVAVHLAPVGDRELRVQDGERDFDDIVFDDDDVVIELEADALTAEVGSLISALSAELEGSFDLERVSA